MALTPVASLRHPAPQSNLPRIGPLGRAVLRLNPRFSYPFTHSTCFKVCTISVRSLWLAIT